MPETSARASETPVSANLPDRLFGILPGNLFRLLAGSARWFYADLLEHLDREVFGLGAGQARQREVVEAIAEFIDRQGRAALVAEEATSAAEPNAAPGSASAASVAYSRLLATGWLVEHRDRYRKAVDIDGGARLLLDLVLEMKRGRTRSYGGEVLQVLSSLEAARARPAERSEGVRNAARSARSFMAHLRSVASALRTVEQAMSAQTEIAAMFGTFFDDFVAQHLVEDFKRLHTQSNPFRFRAQILEHGEAMLADPGLLDELAEAYEREGRAREASGGRAVVEAELRDVLGVFSSIDEHLEVIGGIGRDMERRLRNTVRHLERVAEASTGAVAEAMRALGGVEDLTVPAGPVGLLRPTVPLGPAHLFQGARRRSAPTRTPLQESVPDPAYLAFHAALLAYRERMAATPERVRSYLEAAMAGRSVASAEELPLSSLDDFVAFERLPFLRWMDDPALAAGFRVEPRPGMTFSNGWITCAGFSVRRVADGGRGVA